MLKAICLFNLGQITQFNMMTIITFVKEVLWYLFSFPLIQLQSTQHIGSQVRFYTKMPKLIGQGSNPSLSQIFVASHSILSVWDELLSSTFLNRKHSYFCITFNSQFIFHGAATYYYHILFVESKIFWTEACLIGQHLALYNISV